MTTALLHDDYPILFTSECVILQIIVSHLNRMFSKATRSIMWFSRTTMNSIARNLADIVGFYYGWIVD